tara:strand:- start:220 stop:1080 length:861 start_codon:yes stop_codon:yes gene_type:complete
MKIVKYFFEYIFVATLLLIFKLIGYEKASNLGEKIGKIFGPYFRSKKKIIQNLKISNIEKTNIDEEQLIKNMWGNYGRILAEYPFLKKFKKNIFKNYIQIEGLEYLEEIKKNKKKVVFISGHFNNFELMAMQIENSGIDVAAIYRPLNNIFLNKIMEKIRINHICKKQIKKGKAGTRELLQLFNNGYSIALMIDQRVSEGLPIKFFNQNALTTTIPAQLVKKYNCEIVPIYIERFNKIFFKMYVHKPMMFEKNLSLENITLTLNKKLENMIFKNPDQWIWSHDRWK